MFSSSLDLGSHPLLHSFPRPLNRLSLYLPRRMVPRMAPQNLEMLLGRDRPCWALHQLRIRCQLLMMWRLPRTLQALASPDLHLLLLDRRWVPGRPLLPRLDTRTRRCREGSLIVMRQLPFVDKRIRLKDDAECSFRKSDIFC